MGKIIILWVIWRIKLNTRYKVPGEGLTPTKRATNQAFYSFLPTEQAGRQIRIRKLRDAKRLDQRRAAGEKKCVPTVFAWSSCHLSPVGGLSLFPNKRLRPLTPPCPQLAQVRGKKRCLQRGP